MHSRFDPKKKIYGKVGIQFAQYNTLFQLLAESKNSPNFLDLSGHHADDSGFSEFYAVGK